MVEDSFHEGIILTPPNAPTTQKQSLGEGSEGHENPPPNFSETKIKCGTVRTIMELSKVYEITPVNY